MNYIDKILLSDEKLIYRSHPHWIIFFRPVISLLLAICAFYWGLILMADLAGLITLLSCLSALMVYYTSEFGITNQRVIIKLGFIRRYSFENALNRIEAVEVEQSILGRLLDYGTIRIRGVGGSAELFPAVLNPLLFRHKVQTQIERQRTI
jgi:uncharacterized membrane protein YdbT with pleckstrin-like domain